MNDVVAAKSAARLGLLTRALATQQDMAELLPAFHQHALDSARATSSVLLRLNPRTRALRAASAIGLDAVDAGPWLTSPAGREAAERAWKDGAAQITYDPDVTARLRSPAALVVPLIGRDGPIGVLALGISDPHSAAPTRVGIAAMADLVSLALDRARLERDIELQRDLRDLVADLGRAVSSSLHLSASLEIFCHRAARLFNADRISVWLHDRRARMLELVASSDAVQIAHPQLVPTDDATNPVSMAMRGTSAEVIPVNADSGPPTVLVPLRFRRRALGTLALDGVRVETGDEADLIERLEDVGRQLSAAIENLWLLEEVLRARRELESTFNSLTDVVLVTDRRLRVRHANDALGRRLGRTPAEITQMPLSALLAPTLLSWVEKVSTAPPEEPVAIETRELQDSLLGGTFLFTVSPLAGRDEERIGAVVVGRDITDQARLEVERAELRSRLTQSEKLAALGQFVAGIAHELNNPLQGVLGHVELMLHSATAVSPKLKRDLKLVFREADRAAKIVHNLLVFAGSRRITRRRLNLSLVVGRVTTLRGTACAAAGIDIVKELAPKLPRVSGDSLLLQQALLNIVINAEQALSTIPGPRRIEIRTSRPRPGTVEVRIADNGPGIPADALPRLFEPFYTTKEVGQGTGLGLAIAYGIVQEHGGRLMAANRPEGGAVFTLELPAGVDGVE